MPSPWYRQQHGIEQPLFPAATRVQGRQSVGKPQKLGTAILFGAEQLPQRIGVAAGLKEHGRVHTIQRRSVYRLKFRIAAEDALPSGTTVPRPWPGLQVGEKCRLYVSTRVALDPVGGGPRTVFAE